MFISPQTAIDNGWIWRSSGAEITAAYIQPNAIDFTIDRAFAATGTIDFKAVDTIVDGELKTIKQFPKFSELQATEDPDPMFDRVPMFAVPRQSSIDFLSDFYVDLPEGVAALLIVRSTFNRGGNFVTSGLYDSGFQGNIGAALHNNGSSTAWVGKGTRVGQIIFVQSDSVGSYAGGYNLVAGEVAAQHGPH